MEGSAKIGTATGKEDAKKEPQRKSICRTRWCQNVLLVRPERTYRQVLPQQVVSQTPAPQLETGVIQEKEVATKG